MSIVSDRVLRPTESRVLSGRDDVQVRRLAIHAAGGHRWPVAISGPAMLVPAGFLLAFGLAQVALLSGAQAAHDGTGIHKYPGQDPE